MEPKILIRASRAKWRFVTPRGNVTIEDLWDLPLTGRPDQANLDDIARDLHKQAQSGDQVSFVKETKADTSLQQRFDIVKFVIDTKVADAKRVESSRLRADRRQKIMEIIESKQSESLAAKSIKSLRDLLDKENEADEEAEAA